MSTDRHILVVGAGSSGAALAARLTELPNLRVTLLEAGPDYRSSDRPAAMISPNPFRMINDPAFAGFRYDDLMARRSATQEPKLYWRGRGLGGSSAINGQIAIRGMLEDFDDWAGQGCAGWSGDEVLPYFNRLETDLDFGDQPYHGNSGPLPIYRAPQEQWGPIDIALRESALELGYAWAPDCNAPGSTGVSPYPINSRNGERISTNDAYLDPVRDRPNLTILGNAQVDRVRFDGRRAIGVTAIIDGGRTDIDADEVVLAAGAVHTPPILLRSGIGPASMVAAIGAPLRADLPVGKNLVEHSAIWLGVRIKPEFQVDSIDARHTNCCVRYSSGLADTGMNDMMMVAMNLSDYQEAGREVGEIIVATFQTFSRGELRVTSNDPFAHPEIDLGMLSDERDLLRMRDGMQRLFTISQQWPFRQMASSIFSTITGDVVTELPPPHVLDQWLLDNVWDAQHPVGTCRMGAADDPRTVVDPEGRVLGVEGLRVADASIMPENPRANTHLTSVMIGERISDLMRARYA